LDGVRKEKQALQGKIKQLDEAIKAIDNELNSLSEELKLVSQKRDKAYESIQQLRKQRDEGVGFYFVTTFIDPSVRARICGPKVEHALGGTN
jgi:septal ring factor EnvC (AmiA/AmiB activator)